MWLRAKVAIWLKRIGIWRLAWFGSRRPQVLFLSKATWTAHARSLFSQPTAITVPRIFIEVGILGLTEQRRKSPCSSSVRSPTFLLSLRLYSFRAERPRPALPRCPQLTERGIALPWLDIGSKSQ